MGIATRGISWGILQEVLDYTVLPRDRPWRTSGSLKHQLRSIRYESNQLWKQWRLLGKSGTAGLGNHLMSTQARNSTTTSLTGGAYFLSLGLTFSTSTIVCSQGPSLQINQPGKRPSIHLWAWAPPHCSHPRLSWWLSVPIPMLLKLTYANISQQGGAPKIAKLTCKLVNSGLLRIQLYHTIPG